MINYPGSSPFFGQIKCILNCYQVPLEKLWVQILAQETTSNFLTISFDVNTPMINYFGSSPFFAQIKWILNRYQATFNFKFWPRRQF